MSFSDGLRAREMVIASREMQEYRCTKSVIGVKPEEQNGSYIRADHPKDAARKYFETFPDDREVTVELWKDSNHHRVDSGVGYRVFTRADVAKP